jgi:hypothetical protein
MHQKPLTLGLVGLDGFRQFNWIFVVFPERRHISKKMHRICLEVIIGTLNLLGLSHCMVGLTSLRFEENLS